MNKCPVISLDAWKQKKQSALQPDFFPTMRDAGSAKKERENIHDLRIMTVSQRGAHRWPVIKPRPAGMAPTDDDPAA